MAAGGASPRPVVRLSDVTLHYGKTLALNGINLDVPAGKMVGLIGPDGVGKSSTFALIAGAHVIQSGRVEVLGGDMADAEHRLAVCPRIAYMPQGLGRNLYPTLSVFENSDFFARLFGYDRQERERRIDELLQATALAPFPDRPAGKLSGGMKQKLGLCCALIHDPDLLILDEPTTGVDPLSRRQFWELIDQHSGCPARHECYGRHGLYGRSHALRLAGGHVRRQGFGYRLSPGTDPKGRGHHPGRGLY